jgi:hypothetical protein
MKGISVVAILFFLGVASDVRADECCKPPRRVVEFKCVSPCDILTGVGCYLKDVTCLTVDGVKTVVTAPFKAECCIPKPKRWVYVKPEWSYERGYFKKLDEPTHYKGFPLVPPKIDMGKPLPKDKEYILPLHRDPAESTDFVTLYKRKF